MLHAILIDDVLYASFTLANNKQKHILLKTFNTNHSIYIPLRPNIQY